MQPRPGSRKAQVHTVWKEQGADPAEELGLSLGLAPGTLTSWFKTWEKYYGGQRQDGGRDLSNPVRPPATKDGDRDTRGLKSGTGKRIVPRDGNSATGKARVRYRGKGAQRTGVLIQEGPEVSEVRWSNGLTQFIPNDHLTKVETRR